MYILDGYRPDDVTALFAIEQACFRRGLRWTARGFRQALRDSESWVAYQESRPIGLLVSWVERGVPYIASIAVLEEFRGRGIASQLIENAERHYGSEYGRISLQVRADNPAQTLYFRLGYRVSGFRKGVVRMEKVLNEIR